MLILFCNFFKIQIQLAQLKFSTKHQFLVPKTGILPEMELQPLQCIFNYTNSGIRSGD